MSILGNTVHQRILAVLTDALGAAANIRSFGIFGSIARGDWDDYSDLDLDAIVTDTAGITIRSHVAAIEQALRRQGMATLLRFEEGPNAWVFILESLDRLSIRFHSLDETSPNIIGSLVILAGKLSKDEIAHAAAGHPKQQPDALLMHTKFLEHAIYVPVYLHRGEVMNAYNMLTTLRNGFLMLYCVSHGLPKIEKFEKNAPEALKAALRPTYSSLDETAIRQSFTQLLRVYAESVETVSAAALHLTKEQKLILEKALAY
ncbi:MAG TPA: nucleotidyltransferase domain-containing protein [Candidatus Saccharimonadales bacterium]|nr:nucleotidyltransferase domain-containing protein [Candidatus Saccharimonadales bacterium]